MSQYRLTFNEEQARLIVQAMDAYSRLSIGQFDAAIGSTWMHKILEVDRKEVEYHCNQLKKIFTGMDHPGASYGIYSKEILDRARIAWDIQQVVRNRLAWDKNPEGGFTVNFDSPMKSSEQPLPMIEKRIEDD